MIRIRPNLAALALPLVTALAFLYPDAPATQVETVATKQITLDQFAYGYLGLDGSTGQRFEQWWLGHGGPRRVNTRKHPIATFDPLSCRYVYGTLCQLAVDSLDAAAVADPGRPTY